MRETLGLSVVSPGTLNLAVPAAVLRPVVSEANAHVRARGSAASARLRRSWWSQ